MPDAFRKVTKDINICFSILTGNNGTRFHMKRRLKNGKKQRKEKKEMSGPGLDSLCQEKRANS